MKRGLFAVSKLFTGEDVFLSFGVLMGLTPRPGGSLYPPPQVPQNAAQVIRWQLQHRQQRPNTPRWRPGASPGRQSAYHGHILSKAGSFNIRTQQNKYLVAFEAMKEHAQISYLLKIFGFLRVLWCFCVRILWTIYVSFICGQYRNFVRAENTVKIKRRAP